MDGFIMFHPRDLSRSNQMKQTARMFIEHVGPQVFSQSNSPVFTMFLYCNDCNDGLVDPISFNIFSPATTRDFQSFDRSLNRPRLRPPIWARAGIQLQGFDGGIVGLAALGPALLSASEGKNPGRRQSYKKTRKNQTSATNSLFEKRNGFIKKNKCWQLQSLQLQNPMKTLCLTDV